jgi:outer membrane protein OmpA-like peptidoglycan-associated protein
MYKPLLVAAGAALLLSACERPQAVVAAASPQTAQPARNFMLFFGNDQATLTPDGDVVVHEAVGAAKASPNSRITVAGHADTSGNSAYNQALSQRRAAAVKEALIRQGINEAAISVVGRGEQELLVSTQDGVREPKNRRVEIIVQ